MLCMPRASVVDLHKGVDGRADGGVPLSGAGDDIEGLEVLRGSGDYRPDHSQQRIWFVSVARVGVVVVRAIVRGTQCRIEASCIEKIGTNIKIIIRVPNLATESQYHSHGVIAWNAWTIEMIRIHLFRRLLVDDGVILELERHMVSHHVRIVVEFGIDLLMVIVNWVCVGDPVVGPDKAVAVYPVPCAACLPGSTVIDCIRIAPDLDADLRIFFKVAPGGINVRCTPVMP